MTTDELRTMKQAERAELEAAAFADAAIAEIRAEVEAETEPEPVKPELTGARIQDAYIALMNARQDLYEVTEDAINALAEIEYKERQAKAAFEIAQMNVELVRALLRLAEIETQLSIKY